MLSREVNALMTSSCSSCRVSRSVMLSSVVWLISARATTPWQTRRSGFRLVVEVKVTVLAPDAAHLVVAVHLPDLNAHLVVLLGGHLAGGRVRVPQELPRPADSVVAVPA